MGKTEWSGGDIALMNPRTKDTDRHGGDKKLAATMLEMPFTAL